MAIMVSPVRDNSMNAATIGLCGRVSVALAFAAVWALAGCSEDSKGAAGAAPEVTIVTVTPKTIPQPRSFVAQTASSRQVEIVARVLRRLEVPRNVIEARLREARRELPEECARRTAPLPRNVLGASAELSQMKVDSLEVRSGSHAEGRTLVDLDLRRRSGVTVFALRRNGGIVDARGLATTALHRGDVLFVVGTNDAVRVASDVLSHGDAATG